MRTYEPYPPIEEIDRFWRVRTPGLPLEYGRPYPMNVPPNLHPSRPKTTSPQSIGPIPAWVREVWKDPSVRRSRNVGIRGPITLESLHRCRPITLKPR